MKPYVILICIVVIAVIAVVVIIAKKKKTNSAAGGVVQPSSSMEVALSEPANQFAMTVSFDSLPALTEEQDLQLVEIQDSQLLSRIDSVIPGTLQAVANTGSAVAANEMVKQAGQIYRAVIPQGAVLDHSRAMEGAFRGSYRDVANSIKGNANWVPVDASSDKGLAAVNAANAVMGVASMVVGQYYMTQINDQLGEMSNRLDSIASFQDNEYKSKVYTLVAEVQKISTFQMEIMEIDELRKRELDHLKELETKCAELLSQANLTLDDFSKRKGVDYDTYESLVGKANSWYQYQQVLLQVMYKISELTHALNLGEVSREYSYALFLPHAKQAMITQEKLTDWHEQTCKRLEIDTDAAWRKRQGVGGFLLGIPGFFFDDLNYKSIPKGTVQMIRKQSDSSSMDAAFSSDDLFKEDVQLIAKDGKLYYLPVSEAQEGTHSS